jgi:hypothetical protein
MLRDIDLSEVSDGRLYQNNDMVKTDCNGCSGCSDCCHGMGSSITLDPYDIYQLCSGLQTSFEQLLNGYVELNVADGIILPNLRMADSTDGCSFLTPEGRCRIHNIRPGICRLFPLGRFYEDADFRYFLQIHECPYPNKTKTKIRKWLGVERIKEYETFIKDWHYFLKPLQEYAMTFEDSEKIQSISMYLLQNFYLLPYKTDQDFYPQFYARLAQAREALQLG